MDNVALQDRMEKLPNEIFLATNNAINAETELHKIQAEYESELDRSYLILKTENEKATVKELEAMAREKCFRKRLEVIEKEAKFKSLKNQAEKLKTGFAVCQSSIKLRVAEMQSGG